MSVLRDNRDSLLAMLQAFVHDPLISWRLLGTQHKAGSASTPTNNAPSLPSDHSEPGNGAKPTGAATVAAVAPAQMIIVCQPTALRMRSFISPPLFLLSSPASRCRET